MPSANRGGSVQSDCGVLGSLAQAGVPGLFPCNHPFQEIKQPTIHWASIWPPFPPSKSGLKHNTRQPAGSQSRNSAGTPSFIHPSIDDANSASTFPTPSPAPRLPLSTHLPSSPTHPAQVWVGSITNSSLGILLPPHTHPVTSHLLWPLPFTFSLSP